MVGYSIPGGGVVVGSKTERIYQFGTGAIEYDINKGIAKSFKLDPTRFAADGLLDTAGRWFAPAVGIGFSALNAASGFSQGGFSGLANALSIDYGMMLGMSVVAAPRIEKIKDGPNSGKFLLKNASTLKSAGAIMGGAIGATIGNEALGTVGSVIGGVAGSAMLGTKYGLIATGAIAGGVAVSYGTYSLLKSGYRHGRNIRMSRVPHTAGDTSSFFTQNAFTMRSQAIQAMRNSHLNARTALGQEATFMHTNKNYFSRYR